MLWKTRIALLALLLAAIPLPAQTPPRDPKMDAFVSRLMSQMTLDEKIGQLNLLSVGFDVTGPIVSQDVDAKIRKGLVGGVFNTYTPTAARRLQALAVEQSRLHIPLLLGYDVIHGHRTIFPIPLALSCTWDTNLITRSARIAAKEATADGLNWTFSPMVDIARDPRWGRIAESAGEDPYLGSLIARAMVQGYQGDDLSRSNALLACVKHFALYGAAEAGRDYNTVDMSRLKMYEYYLPPYRAAVAAGAASVMTSFNEVDAVPATGNRWLLTDLLRHQWGFDGFVVTDYTAVNEMTQHGMGDLKQDVALALKAGTDMDMVGEGFLQYSKQLVAEKTVPLATINEACKKILEAKYKLGLFTDPYHGCTPERAAGEIFTEENRKAARVIAEHSIVLLKNNDQTLPLKKSGTIALIGPLADDQRNLIGSWSAAGDWHQTVSVWAGITNLVGSSATILHAQGANLIDDPYLLNTLNLAGGDIVTNRTSPQEMINEAVSVANSSDVIVAVLGESQNMSGEAASRSDIGLPDNQEKLLQALVATGKPVVLVLLNGRPLTLTWENDHCAAILETWFGGTEAGNATATVLFGDYNPSGKLTATFPRNVGQIPVYYNHKNTGRPRFGQSPDKYRSRYLDVPNEPLYPFGHGLSYTTFSYSDIHLDRTNLTDNATLTASITVTNTGKYTGEETVQFYLTDPVASVTRSVEDLRGFQKIHLAPGESREVTFHITTDDLKFYNSDLVYDWEPGTFLIRLGPSSVQLHDGTVNWNRTKPKKFFSFH